MNKRIYVSYGNYDPNNRQRVFGVLSDKDTKIGDWCFNKETDFGKDDYYVEISEIDIMDSPDGNKIHYAKGIKRSISEYRARKINQILK